jgi:hypothetical protein
MFLKQLGDDFVFRLDLGLERLNLSILGVILLGCLARLVERTASVVKELLLPLVDLCWLQAKFIAQIGNGHLVHEMPPYSTEFLISAKTSSFSSCHLVYPSLEVE